MKTNANPPAEKTVARLAIEEHANGGFTVSTDGERHMGERSNIVAAYSDATALLAGLAVMVGATSPQSSAETAVRAAMNAG